MSNDLVRYRQEEVHLGGGDVEYRYVESKDGWIASYADAKAALDAQAAEIARLRATISQIMTPGDNYKRLNAALATARREGMAEAADLCDDLPDHQGGICAIAIRMMIDEEDKKAAIRAAAKEGKP